MPAKLNTICYVHNIAQRLTQDFTVKEITGITRTKDDDPTKVIYLKIKAFIPSDQNIESKIEDFENGQIVIIKGKFIGCDGWYTVNATSIKPLPILDFNDMPSIGLNVTLVGLTTKTVMNINGYSTLNFYVEESLGNREPTEFWVEARHDPNNRYLANKTNSINQNMRSTTAILVGLIYYVPPVINEITQEETAEGKHVLELEDISLISTNRNNNTSQQSPNLPWMNQQGSNNNRSYRPPRGATSRRRGRSTLAQMESTNTQNLSAALEANPIPTNMNQTSNNETSEENDN